MSLLLFMFKKIVLDELFPSKKALYQAEMAGKRLSDKLFILSYPRFTSNCSLLQAAAFLTPVKL
jgi:hypothetical protein